jgi:hypothetical protein
MVPLWYPGKPGANRSCLEHGCQDRVHAQGRFALSS